MRVKSVAYVAAIVAGSVASGAASAATVAVTTTTLNIRSGPGPTYSVVGYIPSNGQATVESCISGSRWCRVSYRDRSGWAYSEYMRPTGRTVTRQTTTTVVRRPTAPAPLATPVAPAPVVTEASTEFGVPAIEYSRDETVGAAPVEEDVSESLAAPSDAVIAADQDTLIPPDAVQSYVVSHPLEPVYLNGEVVVGAGLPNSVMLEPVPNYDYDYAYVNREPVLVEPDTRRIVYVYR